MRRSEEHINRVTEPMFSGPMQKAFPILRGFHKRLRQGKQFIMPQAFEITEAKRETRHKRRKEKRDRAALIHEATKRNRRRTVRWW